MKNMSHYIIVGLTVLLPFLLVWLITLLLSFNKYSHINKDTLKKDFTLKKAVGRCNTWLVATTFWMFAEYILVIIPFVTNAIVIYLSLNTETNKEFILVYSIVSSALVVFGYAINPQRHKKCYRKAYTNLDNEINKYLLSATPNDAEKEALIQAMHDGESFIDGSYDIEK